jgi:hypothetical protein
MRLLHVDSANAHQTILAGMTPGLILDIATRSAPPLVAARAAADVPQSSRLLVVPDFGGGVRLSSHRYASRRQLTYCSAYQSALLQKSEAQTEEARQAYGSCELTWTSASVSRPTADSYSEQ